METPTADERREVEIELLEAMYPDQIQFNPHTCELRYTGPHGGNILLRVPTTYPERGLPELISATDTAKNDFRAATKKAMDEMTLPQGEELLDTLVQKFEEVLTKLSDVKSASPQHKEEADSSQALQHSSKTVIVWLHHLLNTNKRKLALDPTLNAGPDGRMVSGITKPGYPGILIYSGPRTLVDSHVAELKQQRWQAFQVRYEESHEKDAEWTFDHGKGVKEVESMSEVVSSIVGEDHKSDFLRATGVR